MLYEQQSKLTTPCHNKNKIVLSERRQISAIFRTREKSLLINLFVHFLYLYMFRRY